jgi:hypothetical protein
MTFTPTHKKVVKRYKVAGRMVEEKLEFQILERFKDGGACLRVHDVATKRFTNWWVDSLDFLKADISNRMMDEQLRLF